jgi:hypothetical protein
MADDISDVTTVGAFEKLLGKLLRTAHENGIDVQGGWDVDGGSDGDPDWDVVVTVVQAADDD